MATIVLSEASDQLTPSASARDIAASTEAARLMGCKVYYIPQDFSVCETAENALAHIPVQAPESPGVWTGYIPSPERYEAIYTAALNKGIRLVNNPREHLTVQEFDQAYPKLTSLTPESFFITDIEQCADAVRAVGLPVFVKGVIQSRKARGWKACTAESVEELQALTKNLLELSDRTRGRVVVRKLVKLRHTRLSPQGFPMGREYRVFIYRQRVVGHGYYWEGDDPLKNLSDRELDEVLSLALDAAARLNVPYVAVDIGQTEDGKWIVIETGDPQFAGVSQISLFKLWGEISRLAEGGF
ncbi:MAG TPA: ATP-grasp domain-containing protein [Blastocatellia bacterium]|nr:ATP-grasp domain-containing protein [Blastocatellia bacterium]